MSVCGMIVEWNPFHNGHAYLIQQLKGRQPDTVIIAIMSGNYVQRGQAALLSKWHRAEVALKNGCDLVVELPFWYAVQPADLFAEGAVGCLHALGCQQLAFGSELEDFSPYQELAQWVSDHEETVALKQQNEAFHANNYGKSSISLLADLVADVPELRHLKIDFTDNSNVLLAYSYAKANAKYQAPMSLTAIKRKGSQHRDQDMSPGANYASSTSIRKALLEDQVDCRQLDWLMPKAMVEKLELVNYDSSWSVLYPLLRYKFLSESRQKLADYYQVYEGIEKKFIESARRETCYADFLNRVTNKKWSKYRIQRALLMIFLGVSDQEMQDHLKKRQPLYLLGANARGRKYLKGLEITDPSSYAMINRVGKDESKAWPLWIRVDEIYQQVVMKSKESQLFAHPPIML
ncbi:tRNA(Met) cytidine acetate ligase [Aerococcus mictus]|uniref:tRNA(Met) cytidine acetate ligase n=1 Tax=Aerococcus mictus TaxID=2976810 RepID=UPI002277ACFE|nr:nucleotidyltransferase family protein [Aerococcus mictus]MCY3084735.1 nucleotidyltransferase family protein [Aerococcus mictus]